MALTSRAGQAYGDQQADIAEYLRGYSESGYPAEQFADAVCSCNNRTFILCLDETGVDPIS